MVLWNYFQALNCHVCRDTNETFRKQEDHPILVLQNPSGQSSVRLASHICHSCDYSLGHGYSQDYNCSYDTGYDCRCGYDHVTSSSWSQVCLRKADVIVLVSIIDFLCVLLINRVSLISATRSCALEPRVMDSNPLVLNFFFFFQVKFSSIWKNEKMLLLLWNKKSSLLQVVKCFIGYEWFFLKINKYVSENNLVNHMFNLL